MVRRTRQSSFREGANNGTSGPERPDDRPAMPRNASTMSKLSKRGNTSAREHLRESSAMAMPQFFGQPSSHGLHLHVRVTTHPGTQALAQSGQKYGDGAHQNHGNQYQNKIIPNVTRPEVIPVEVKMNYSRYNGGTTIDHETGMVSSYHGNGRESRKSLYNRRMQQETVLPPIESSPSGRPAFRTPEDSYGWQSTNKLGKSGAPTSRSPQVRTVDERHLRSSLIRDKTVSTIESLKLPDCSPVASAVKRKRKKKHMFKDPKEVTNGKLPEQVTILPPPITDMTKKLQIGNSAETQDRVERNTHDRTHDQPVEEWKRYSSLGSNVSHNEPFSIRKKIEQFKKWHEEQYKDKLHKLAKIESETMSGKENVNKKTLDSETSTLQSQGLNDTLDDKRTGSPSLEETRLPEVHSKEQSSTRQKSARTWKTWKTWRDVNESDAYHDVKKYIEENELMTEEKQEWIQKWVANVDQEFFGITSSGTDMDSSLSAGSSAGVATV